MNVRRTGLPGVLVIEPRVFSDSRGFFFETYNSERYAQAGLPERFVQDQAGHRYGSTTAIYTAVSDEYRNRLLTRVLREQHGNDLYPHEATS